MQFQLILMECAEYDLDHVLYARTFTAPEILVVFEQLVDAIDIISKLGIIHFDLKPSNFVVCGDGLMKLADFGIARELEQGETHISRQGACGTLYYMAPEVLYQTHQNKLKLTHAVDIWSLGILLHVMMYRRIPYAAFMNSSARLMMAIADAQNEIIFPVC